MRVAVIGASGNVGTALLRRLAADATVTSVVGIVRRPPPEAVRDAHDLPAPYDVASWVACDLAGTGPDGWVVEPLAAALTGADAVVHLAWAHEPSHDRAAMRRTNVLGTRRVTEATLRAGVPHLVVASSVGVYSPAGDDTARAEGWATDGVRSSAHSVDKVAVERLLDEVERLHPDLAIARVRSAPAFQRSAGDQVARMFLGGLRPLVRLASNTDLAWPRGWRLQAVHSDDLASAYREIVVRRHRGAFNVAATDVLSGRDVADIVAGGHLREVSPGLVRAVVSAAWHARLAPAEPAWIDLAGAVPVLDTARARRLLDFRPVHTSAESLAELVAGITEGAGTASPPLRPRRGTAPG